MKSIFLIIIFYFGVVFSVKSTGQTPDILVYKGVQYSLHNNPLESYFAKFPDKRPKTNIISSALWRGYRATFELIDSILFLKDIEIQVSDSAASNPSKHKWKSVMSDVFTSTDTLKVNWCDGILMLPGGEIKHYVH